MQSLKQLFDLTGQKAVITGGLGHLGLACSETLLELGADLILSGLKQEKKESSTVEKLAELRKLFPQRKIYFEGLDFRDDQSIRGFFQKAEQIFQGRLDILINNAVFSVSKPVEEMTFEEFSQGVDGALGSVFKCSKLAFPLLKEKGGVIINISSMYGLVAPDFRVYTDKKRGSPINYGTAKAGVIQLTKYLASYWAKYGIRVNSISPGPFSKGAGLADPDFQKLLRAKTMLNRVGRPEEIKGLIALLSSEASSYITGQNFIIDGGWTAW